MNTPKMSRLALVTLLGATLTGASLLSAHADDTSRMHSNSDRDSSWKDDDDAFADLDAAPVSYPEALPGSLNLYHWKDYTNTSLKYGSVMDTRYWRQVKLDKMRHDRMMAYESNDQSAMMHRDKGDKSDWDVTMYDPAPVRYPNAEPGALHLYHWTDYTRNSLAFGSADDARWTAMEKMDRERMQESRMHRDKSDMSDWDATMYDPNPVTYPNVLPGAVHLYHWTDYRRDSLSFGSADDTREQQMRKTEKMRRDQMKQNSNSGS